MRGVGRCPLDGQRKKEKFVTFYRMDIYHGSVIRCLNDERYVL